MDDLYSSSTSSDISINSTHSNNSSYDRTKKNNKKNHKKNKKKKKQNYQDFIRAETNIFEIFNNKNNYNQQYDKISDLELKNDIQKKYLSYLNDINSPIIFAIGPAGTGKTFLACYYAIVKFMCEDMDKIIITRPTVSVDEEHGFLPGSLNDKMRPWLRPLYDIFEKYLAPNYIQKLIRDEMIEICPLAYMRGRTFDNCVIIADEMQNSTESQMKMILTRIGFNSKLIINGDLNQSDNKRNGLCDFVNKYNESSDKNKEDIKIVKFENINIQRNPIISTILNIYK
jgi:phosphate starvation-inducible protein PhoH and related proteins